MESKSLDLAVKSKDLDSKIIIMPSFYEKLLQSIEQNNSLLCVGLDPDPTRFPAHFPQIETDPLQALLNWGKTLIEQTADLVCCYKPNFAFYEQYGAAGLEAMRQTIAAVPAPIPVLLDAKRGDIGHTAAAYAKAAFEVWQADAITISPYLGQDSVMPFVQYTDKTVFILCYTSNPSAQEMQEFGAHGISLFEYVAQKGQTWGSVEQIGFVVGATQPQALARVRNLAPDHWFLAPGVGAQGGNLAKALAAGLNSQKSGMIIPVSREIIFAQEPRTVANHLRNEINQTRNNIAQRQRFEATPLSAHQELIQQLHEVGCIQFGDFTLASGKSSPIYVDLRRVTASHVLLRLVAQAYVTLLTPLTFDHIAAVPYAALPIGTAVALNINKPLIYPRKEVKAYGLGRSIEGYFEAGDSSVVIEDLITSGGSVLKAIEQLEAAQIKVQDVAVLIDREQGGAEALRAKGYRLHAALTLPEIIKTLHGLGRISSTEAQQVQAYLRS